MILTDEEVLAGFAGLCAAIAALSGAVVKLWVNESRCQQRMNQLWERISSSHRVLDLDGEDAEDHPHPRRRKRRKRRPDDHA